MHQPILVTTTFEERPQAEELVGLLLRERLIACGQISGPVTSSYWWKGEVAVATEYVLAMKAMAEDFDRLEQAIRAFHPYEVPEIVAVPIIAVSRGYRDWLLQELHK